MRLATDTSTTQAVESANQADTQQGLRKIMGDPGDMAMKITQNAPQLDNSTPDKTVESFWTLDNYLTYERQISEHTSAAKALASWGKEAYEKENQAAFKLRQRCVEQPMLKNYQPNNGNELKATTSSVDLSDPYTTSEGDYRKIQNVDMQTPTRAIVWVKLTDPKPIPTEVRSQMIDLDIKLHDKGFSAQYILDKDTSGWKIMDISILNPLSGEWEDKFGTAKPEIPAGVDSGYIPNEGELY